MNDLASKIDAIVTLLNEVYRSVYFDRGLLSDINKNDKREYPLFYLLPISSNFNPIVNSYSFAKTYTVRMYVLQNTNEEGLDVNNESQSTLTDECELLAEEFIKLFNTTYPTLIQSSINIEEIRGLADFTNYHVAGVLITLNIQMEAFIDCI